MFGTLIGIFITSTAIVIGADRAASDGREREKACKTSESSVATIQGYYEFSGASGPPIDFMKTFKAQCKALHDSSKKQTIEDQADIIIKELRSDLQTRLGKIPQKDLEDLYRSESGHIIYVSVSGYESGAPKVFVRELALKQNGDWETAIPEEPTLFQNMCGARFHGHAKIAVMLTHAPPAYDIIPQAEFKRREVVAVRKVEGKKDCLPFTPEYAEQLFKTAVRLTIDLGDKVGIPAGRVGGTLDLWSISSDGKVSRQDVPKGKY